jgi:hypothetical protein
LLFSGSMDFGSWSRCFCLPCSINHLVSFLGILFIFRRRLDWDIYICTSLFLKRVIYENKKTW